MSVVPPTASSSAPVIPPTPNGSATPSTQTTTYNDATSSRGTTDGDADSPKAAQPIVDPGYHALALAEWTFNVGYMHQEWSDVHLTFFTSGLKAHRLILARSPYIAGLMRDVAPGSTIHLSFQDENITEESVHVALQYLYNPMQHLVNAKNARSVLSTSYLFGGMPELAHHAYTIIRGSLDPSNIAEYVKWLSAPAPDGYRNWHGNGTMYGSVKVDDGDVREGSHGWNDSQARYGEWTVRLKQDVLEYLLRVLPSQITSSGSSLTSDPRLLSTYVSLPYDLFKTLIESKELPIVSMQDRFAFAKKVIAGRKKLNAAAIATGAGNSGQLEESVVLAFKGGDGMEVHITRKPKKSRVLWKVEG